MICRVVKYDYYLGTIIKYWDILSETCLQTRAGACGDQSVDIPPVARRRRLMSCDGASLGSRSRIDISPLLNVLPAVTVPKI